MDHYYTENVLDSGVTASGDKADIAKTNKCSATLFNAKYNAVRDNVDVYIVPLHDQHYSEKSFALVHDFRNTEENFEY